MVCRKGRASWDRGGIELWSASRSDYSMEGLSCHGYAGGIVAGNVLGRGEGGCANATMDIIRPRSHNTHADLAKATPVDRKIASMLSRRTCLGLCCCL